MNTKNQVKLKEKEPKIGDFRLNVAEREGFEPSCAWAQTDFESAPLWPLRYLSVLSCVWILHGFCKADSEMLSSKIQEKWSIWEILRENESFRGLQSDKLGYLSSQSRYDHFDTLPCNNYSVLERNNMISSQPRYDHFDTSPCMLTFR